MHDSRSGVLPACGVETRLKAVTPCRSRYSLLRRAIPSLLLMSALPFRCSPCVYVVYSCNGCVRSRELRPLDLEDCKDCRHRCARNDAGDFRWRLVQRGAVGKLPKNTTDHFVDGRTRIVRGFLRDL